MNYDLNKLLAWTRRAAGDRAQRTREQFTGDGLEVEYTLSNEGGITIASLTVEGVEQNLSTDYTMDGNVLAFKTAPADTDRIVVVYAYTRYTNAEVVEFLSDAALTVGGDVGIAWTISTNTPGKIIDVPDTLAAGTDLDQGLKKLLVLAAADAVVSDKSNTAADEAIMVRDGSTTIDTSKASGASEKAIERIGERYKDALMEYRARKFRGVAQSDWLIRRTWRHGTGFNQAAY